jgi:tRNA threonylcarbamoyladenosine modification (KEOPS) complex Cgi121 subunit
VPQGSPRAGGGGRRGLAAEVASRGNEGEEGERNRWEARGEGDIFELLLRLACTGQIAEAIKRAGLKKDAAGCFIAFSENGEALRQFSDRIRNEFEADNSVLNPTKEKKARLANMLGVKTKFDDGEFLKYLLERAAILTK